MRSNPQKHLYPQLIRNEIYIQSDLSTDTKMRINKMTDNVEKNAMEKRFPPCFLGLSGPQNHTPSPDTRQWQYHHVTNIETGLNVVSSFPSPSLGPGGQ